jgi:hypothetical protein
MTLAPLDWKPAGLWARLKPHWPALAVLLYFAVFFDNFLFMTAGVYERDAFYHARFSQMLPEHGLSRSFPWMQFTSWNESFCDKDFIYHLLLMPFCRFSSDALAGAKLATVVLNLFMLASLYFVLARLKTPWPIFWVALFVVGSGLFLSRLLMIRSHTLSIVLTIWSLVAIMEGRFRLLALLGFLYSWSYSFPLALVLTALGAEAGRAFAEGFPKRVPRTVLACALGVGAGLIAHPYSPHTLGMLWLLLNISAAGVARSHVELGSEFQPVAAGEVVFALPGLLLAFLFALGGGVWLRIKRPDAVSKSTALALGAACAWFCAIFIFSRLIEYFAPAVILAAALVMRDMAGERLSLTPFAPARRQRVLLMLLPAVLLLAACHEFSSMQVRAVYLSQTKHYASPEAFVKGRYFDGAAQWMKQNLRPAETVINFHWDDFPELYYSAPQQHYIVGLDPTLLRLKHPELSAMLEAMRTEAQPLDFKKLGEMFNARYVIMRRYRANACKPLREGRPVPVFMDEGAVIYATGTDLPHVSRTRANEGVASFGRGIHHQAPILKRKLALQSYWSMFLISMSWWE